MHKQLDYIINSACEYVMFWKMLKIPTGTNKERARLANHVYEILTCLMLLCATHIDQSYHRIKLGIISFLSLSVKISCPLQLLAFCFVLPVSSCLSLSRDFEKKKRNKSWLILFLYLCYSLERCVIVYKYIFVFNSFHK